MNSTHIIADDVCVHKSTDYDLFFLDTRNRPIEPGKVAKMQRKVQGKNLLRLYPIVVTKEGIILDGQHRYVVARRLEVPIYYIIANKGEMDIADVAMTNMLTKRWTSHDYLNLHAGQGSPEYLSIKKFMAQYPSLKISTVINIGNATSRMVDVDDKKSKRVMDAFRLGFYIFDPVLITQLSEFGISIADVAPLWWRREFMGSLKHMFSHPDFSVRKMHSQIYRAAHLVKNVNRHDDALLMLQSIYNYRQQQRVAFYIP